LTRRRRSLPGCATESRSDADGSNWTSGASRRKRPSVRSRLRPDLPDRPAAARAPDGLGRVTVDRPADLATARADQFEKRLVHPHEGRDGGGRYRRGPPILPPAADESTLEIGSDVARSAIQVQSNSARVEQGARSVDVHNDRHAVVGHVRRRNMSARPSATTTLAGRRDAACGGRNTASSTPSCRLPAHQNGRWSSPRSAMLAPLDAIGEDVRARLVLRAQPRNDAGALGL
jgi:hypothetical protein